VNNELRLILDAHSICGEGAIWDEKNRKLYWVDNHLGFVHVYDPETNRDRAIDVGQPVGTVVPRESGGLMLAVRDGFMSLDEMTRKTRLLAVPEGHNPENRFNDGKCDPAGRFWAGTLETPTHKGCLFRLDKDLLVHRMLDNIRCSNGIVWSADNKTMYYIDTPTMRIDAFDYDLKTGTISNRRAVVSVAGEHGQPDGMAIDIEGKLWVAHWDGCCVCRWDPTNGNLIQKVRLPVSRPTSCAFAGQNLDTLYVTSASAGLDAVALAKQPKAGGLFQFNPRVRGLTSFSFAG